MDEEREAIIARLILNTRRRERPDNLVRIANDIRWLEHDLGSLKIVSKVLDISTDMLRQFLSVEKLCPEVRKLVEERKIDLIRIVHNMRNFDAESQKIIANEVIEGQLSGNDVRILYPLHKSLPDLTIEQLILRVQKSKNIKVYVAYFRIPIEFKNNQLLLKRFEEIVGKDEIISFSIKNSIGMLELTLSGQKKLRQVAKERKLSLKKFVNDFVLRGV